MLAPNLDREVLDLALGLVVLVALVVSWRGYASMTGSEHASADDHVTPLPDSFCRYAVGNRRPLIISDTRTSEPLASLPAVRNLEVIAYAGVRLIDEQGQALGALDAVDSRPREWRELDISVLTRLAAIATARLVALKRAPARAA
jgi:GAF domain-containing protein